MANGRVCTGFSHPYVAKYNVTGSTVSYTGAIPLARGVSVQIQPNTDESGNSFYADNTTAETSGGILTGGTLNVTVDGLKEDARKLVLGVPNASTDGWTAYGDEQVIPFVGFGYIDRWMEDGVTTYRPVVIAKCAFNNPENAAETQGENITFQTQNMTASIHRSDDANHNWKFEGSHVSTEAAALTALRKKLGLSS